MEFKEKNEYAIYNATKGVIVTLSNYNTADYCGNLDFLGMDCVEFWTEDLEGLKAIVKNGDGNIKYIGNLVLYSSNSKYIIKSNFFKIVKRTSKIEILE